ncbi:single-strand binding protein, partial [Thauera phenylacetica B4P]
GEGGGWDAGAQSAPARQPAAPAQRAQPQSAPPQQSGGFGDFDDDIPF